MEIFFVLIHIKVSKKLGLWCSTSPGPWNLRRLHNLKPTQVQAAAANLEPPRTQFGAVQLRVSNGVPVTVTVTVNFKQWVAMDGSFLDILAVGSCTLDLIFLLFSSRIVSFGFPKRITQILGILASRVGSGHIGGATICMALYKFKILLLFFHQKKYYNFLKCKSHQYLLTRIFLKNW